MDYSVTDYGATGDGITDDRAAIQACVDAAHAAGGGTVTFPPGTFVVSGQSDPTLGCIMLYSDITVAGAGMGQTTIKLQDGWNGPITGIFRDPYNAGSSNITARDLTIDGNRANTTGKVDGWFSGTAPGSSVQDHDITLDHVEIKDCGGYGFDPHEQTVGLVITNCVSHGNALDGFALDYQIGAVIRDNVAYGNDRHGFNVVTSSRDMQMIDNEAYGNGSVGVMVQRGSSDVPVPNNIVITGGSYHDNGKDGFQINKADNVVIDRADIYNNGQRGVRVIGSVGTVVENSTLHDNSASKTTGYEEISIQSYDDTAGVSGRWYYTRSVRVLNNTIYDTGGAKANYAIREYTDGTDYTLLSGNIISGVAHTTPLLVGAHSSATLPDMAIIFGTNASDLIHGVDGAATLYAYLGNDTLYGAGQGDLLIGAQGDDGLFGGDGDDTYAFVQGDGRDILTDTGGKDVITFDASVDAGAVGYSQSGADLIITDGFAGDSLTVIGFFADLASEIERVQFSGGLVHDLAWIIQQAHTGTDGGDSLTGLADPAFVNDTLSGRGGDDTLSGGAGNDSLDGGTGSDRLEGGAGDDTYLFRQGDGNDIISEGGGSDTVLFDASVAAAAVVYSQSGSDLIISDGFTGDSITVSGFFSDVLHEIESVRFDDGTVHDLAWIIQQAHTGTDGADNLSGLADPAFADDTLSGLGGDDTLSGGAGRDSLDGGAGNDALYGGSGDDTYVFRPGDGQDRVAEAGGSDVLVFGAGISAGAVRYSQSGADLVITNGVVGDRVTVTGFFTDPLNQIDSVRFDDGAVHSLAYIIQQSHTQTGSGGGDTLTGLSDSHYPDDVLFGKGGDDLLSGGAGSDVLDGGAGADTLYGGLGNDSYSVENAGDVVIEQADEGIDTVKTNLASYVLGANIENLILVANGNIDGTGNSLDNVLTGNSGNNSLTGGRGNDTLSGGGGDDFLNGGTGADRMIGGAGNDTFQYGVGDTIVEAENGGIDTVLSTVNAMTLGYTLENVTLIGSALSANGNALANVMTGNAQDNTLRGGDGHDTLDGMAGNDTLQGGQGADLLHGGGGDDVFLYVKLSDSTLTAMDFVDDFSATDRLDLHLIDADVHTAGDQAFQLVDAFSHHEGELVLTYNADTDQTSVSADANGDAIADLVILLVGHITTTTDWDL